MRNPFFAITKTESKYTYTIALRHGSKGTGRAVAYDTVVKHDPASLASRVADLIRFANERCGVPVSPAYTCNRTGLPLEFSHTQVAYLNELSERVAREMEA